MVETICLKHWHFCQIIRPSLGTSHRTYICHSMFHIKKKKEQLNIWREKSALALVDSSDSSPWGLLWPHLVVATHAIFTVSNGQKEKWKTLWENITGNSCSRCGPHGTSGGQVVVLVALVRCPPIQYLSTYWPLLTILTSFAFQSKFIQNWSQFLSIYSKIYHLT